MHENRETSWSASARKGTRPVREGAKPEGAHAPEESDSGIHILSMNQTNKEEFIFAEPGSKGVSRRTSFNPTLTRYRAGNECPRD